MRPFVYIILLVYALVLFAGALHFVGKILRKANKEKHYTFYNFKNKTKKGYALDNDNKKHVFYALKSKEEDGRAIYRFTNGKTKISVNHKISGLGNNNKAPNFTNKSFLFDENDIWEFLKNNSIAIETTTVDDTLIMYKIKRNDNPIAIARKRKEKNQNGNIVYSLRTYEKNLEPLFICLFALAQTEKHFDHFKKQN